MKRAHRRLSRRIPDLSGERMMPSHFNQHGRAKKAYKTKEAAVAFVKRHHGEHTSYWAYRCHTCGDFHVGH